ncbi:MAG: DUF2089 domain-containing protein [Bacteroidales bacterium]|nr:DUF2089 domain-containing protein [Bacteroidales bacterium]MCF8328225.1 DUF2089 domain-containing protein [Bacteroidales bacterium]
MAQKTLPKYCPGCNNLLKVQRLYCDSCETNVEGLYELPLLARLDNESQKFIISFVKNSGSLKKMAKELGMSYPTVRNMLNEIIEKVDRFESIQNDESSNSQKE